MSAYLWRGKVAGVVSIEAAPAAIYGSMAVSMTAMLLFALQFLLLEARRLGFFAGLLVSVALSPKNENFSHSLVTNRRISSSDGSAPKTMRATPYLPPSTCSASPTQN